MRIACMTLISQKLVLHHVSSLRSAWICYVRVQNELYRNNRLGNCFHKQRSHYSSISSCYHGHISLDSTYTACGNSLNILQNSPVASFSCKGYCRQQTASKSLNFLHRTNVVCNKEKTEGSKISLQTEKEFSNYLKHTDLCSSLFETSKTRRFIGLPCSEKHLSLAAPKCCIRPYHTGIWSLPWLQSCCLLKPNSLSVPLYHPEWSRHQCLHQATLPERFDLHKNPTFRQYLESLLSESEHINRILSNPTSEHDVNIKELNRRHVQLTPLVSLIRELEKLAEQIRELDVLVSGLNSTDTELKHMAQTEREDCIKQMEQLQLQLIDLMVGHEQVDKNDIILEVTAGVGGQEAMLFTGEMFDLYQAYSNWKGWSFEVIASDMSDQGGLRKASASVCGVGVYRLLKFESGVHRVQRIPKTEKAGRVHTSTMTVAILPQPTEIEVVIQSKDLRVETFKASGKGGQHVNTTDSAVRITHLPTGMVAECQQERSQIKNKALALQILRSRIYEKELESQQMKYQADRKIQVGTAGRSEKIRTYNFNQDRITDHRINHSMFNLGHFMTTGEDLDSLIFVLLKESQYSVLDEILQDFAENKKKELA